MSIFFKAVPMHPDLVGLTVIVYSAVSSTYVAFYAVEGHGFLKRNRR